MELIVTIRRESSREFEDQVPESPRVRRTPRTLKTVVAVAREGKLPSVVTRQWLQLIDTSKAIKGEGTLQAGKSRPDSSKNHRSFFTFENGSMPFRYDNIGTP